MREPFSIQQVAPTVVHEVFNDDLYVAPNLGRT